MKLATRSDANYYCHDVVCRWIRLNQRRFDTERELHAKLNRLEGALREKYRTTWHFNAVRSSAGLVGTCDLCKKPRTSGREPSFPLRREWHCAECIENPPEQPEPFMRDENSTTLYRYYDSDNALLYVGISNKPGRRLQEHFKGQPWSGLIKKTDFEHFETREEAERAEIDAIKAEKPKHNVVHNR